MSSDNYNVGDELMIVGNISMHLFSNGEKVRVEEVRVGNYLMVNELGESWYVMDEDLAEYKSHGKCPNCGDSLLWQGDNDVLDRDEVYVSTWVCKPCQVEVSMYFGDGLKEEEMV